MNSINVQDLIKFTCNVKSVLENLNGLTVEEALKVIAVVVDTLAESTNSNVFDWYEELVSMTSYVKNDISKLQKN